MARISKKTKVGITLPEAQAAANSYAENSARKDTLIAQMNERLTSIRQKYEPQITELDEAMEEPVDILEAYAKEQRDTWKGKSTELSNCVIGFRTNPASVAKKKGITWDAVVGLLKNSKLLKGFVKVKEDVDKAAILKTQADAKVMKSLAAIGVTIEQEEQFYVDAKKEEVGA